MLTLDKFVGSTAGDMHAISQTKCLFENIKAFVTGVAERRGDDSKLQIIPFIPQDL